jgi:hypothetical protein
MGTIWEIPDELWRRIEAILVEMAIHRCRALAGVTPRNGKNAR